MPEQQNPIQYQAAQEFGAAPDGLERLWTPHRMAYVSGAQKQLPGQDSGQVAASGEKPCPFCLGPETDDEQSLIVYRGETAFVVLNLFPYNTGHLLVCPYRHVADYPELTTAERTEIGDLTATAMRVVRAVATPHGFNLGMNQGDVAGAGIAAHLHQHVVPRWQGDANFFPIIAQTKALPQLLGQTRELLANAWPNFTDTAARGTSA